MTGTCPRCGRKTFGRTCGNFPYCTPVNQTPSGTQALMLAMEIRPLHDLSAWDPVSSRLFTLHAVLTGQEAPSAEDLKRIDGLRAWASRWTSLDRHAKNFFLLYAKDSDLISSALFLYLEDRHIDYRHRGRVKALFRQTYGYDSPVELLPRS